MSFLRKARSTANKAYRTFIRLANIYFIGTLYFFVLLPLVMLRVTSDKLTILLSCLLNSESSPLPSSIFYYETEELRYTEENKVFGIEYGEAFNTVRYYGREGVIILVLLRSRLFSGTYLILTSSGVPSGSKRS